MGEQLPVFVYGTLTDASKVDALLADWRFEGEVILTGFRRVDGTYPTLAPGGQVMGRLLLTPELDRLDAYEGVDNGLYVRVPVPIETGRSAWVYVGDPEILDAPVDWPGSETFVQRVKRYVESSGAQVCRIGNR